MRIFKNMNDTLRSFYYDKYHRFFFYHFIWLYTNTNLFSENGGIDKYIFNRIKI